MYWISYFYHESCGKGRGLTATIQFYTKTVGSHLNHKDRVSTAAWANLCGPVLPNLPPAFPAEETGVPTNETDDFRQNVDICSFHMKTELENFLLRSSKTLLLPQLLLLPPLPLQCYIALSRLSAERWLMLFSHEDCLREILLRIESSTLEVKDKWSINVPH